MVFARQIEIKQVLKQSVIVFKEFLDGSKVVVAERVGHEVQIHVSRGIKSKDAFIAMAEGAPGGVHGDRREGRYHQFIDCRALTGDRFDRSR